MLNLPLASETELLFCTSELMILHSSVPVGTVLERCYSPVNNSGGYFYVLDG